MQIVKAVGSRNGDRSIEFNSYVLVGVLRLKKFPRESVDALLSAWVASVSPRHIYLIVVQNALAEKLSLGRLV